MNNLINIEIAGKGSIQVEKGTKLIDILDSKISDNYPIVAVVNGDIIELSKKIEEDSKVTPIYISDRIGYSVYARTLKFLFILAAKEIIPEIEIITQYAINNEVYGECIGDRPFTDEDINKIKEKMKELIESDDPIEKICLPKQEVIELFKSYKMDDKLKLLKHAPEGLICIYKCRGIYDYFYGPMVPSLGYLKNFDLLKLENGFLLMLPDRNNINYIPPYKDMPKIRAAYRETKVWAKILDIFNVGSMNEKINSGEIKDIILVGEGLHEKKISKIADSIYENMEKQKIVLIAGPSSSGKTTFSKRLSIQLKVLGLKPFNISADDYFINRENMPIDENGKIDFESIKAVDIELLNNNLLDILYGKEVELPRFNFITGTREYRGDKYKIEDNSIIIVEGIHSLNEEMTHSIPKENKFKINVTALTQLNLDNHNSIFVSDVRTIRRIIRDHNTRGRTPEHTILTWPDVRTGEEKNIFPYQEEADVTFNSTIVYEINALKSFVEPLLKEINRNSPAYAEATRILRLLKFFEELEEELIPDNSIIREFIGGSYFDE